MPYAVGQKKKEFLINVLYAWRLSKPCRAPNPKPDNGIRFMHKKEIVKYEKEIARL